MTTCTNTPPGQHFGGYAWGEFLGARLYLGGRTDGAILGFGSGGAFGVSASVNIEGRIGYSVDSEDWADLSFDGSVDGSVGIGTPFFVPVTVSVQDSIGGDQRAHDLGVGFNDYVAVGIGVWTPEYDLFPGDNGQQHRIQQNADGSITLLSFTPIKSGNDIPSGDRYTTVQVTQSIISPDGSTRPDNPTNIDIVHSHDVTSQEAIATAFTANLQGYRSEIASGIVDTLARDDRYIEMLECLYSKFSSPPTSPLVLDLDGDGIELTSVDGATAFFDVGIDGFAEATGWVAADDGLLALDVDGDGRIDDGSELFGDQTGHAHGFLALAQHDDDGDGVIDAADAAYADLVVWQDANADGISQQMSR